MDSNYMPNFKVTVKPCLTFFSKFWIKVSEPNIAKTARHYHVRAILS